MLNKFEKLIDVKSIMTLALTVGFLALVLTDRISGSQFVTIYTVIIGFYFGTQAQKKSEEPQTAPQNSVWQSAVEGPGMLTEQEPGAGRRTELVSDCRTIADALEK